MRYTQVAEQLVERRENVTQFSTGVALFVLGFTKKVLLANPLGTVADAAFGAQSLDAAAAWFGVLAYALQIYFDFCGYFGHGRRAWADVRFRILQNFDAPYRAESIKDFWRRWHISLSMFLRDYLYIPLGGNRASATKTYANLAIVMLLGGLWHGANWTLFFGCLAWRVVDCRTLGGTNAIYHKLHSWRGSLQHSLWCFCLGLVSGSDCY